MMNSKTSLKSSDGLDLKNKKEESATPLFNASATEQGGDKLSKTKAKPSTERSEKDLAIKLKTAQTLASVGYFVRLNVSLSEPPLLSKWGGKLLDLTDVDVLALKHTIDFDTDIVCVSAKSGSAKGLSPIRESFTLAGVMQYFGADRGYAIFSEKKIDPHMVSLAEQLRVALYDDTEWKHWMARTVGIHVIPAHYNEDVDAKLFDALSKWTDLKPLLAYIRNEYWYYRDFRNIQNLIGITRKLASKFNTTALGRFIFCDVLSLFVLSILQLCQFTSTTGITRLTDSVPPYLFGGASNYKSRKDLLKRVEELLRSRSLLTGDQTMPSLDPPYISDLIELVFRYCQKPGVAINVPQYLSTQAGRAALEVHTSTQTPELQEEDSMLEKFASDVASLFVRATGLPSEFASLPDFDPRRPHLGNNPRE